MQHPTPSDDVFMAEALAQAAQALTLSNPNPRVGCVLTTAHGQVLGRGFTQQAGGPHAEIMALRDAAAQGHDVRGAHRPTSRWSPARTTGAPAPAATLCWPQALRAW